MKRVDEKKKTVLEKIAEYGVTIPDSVQRILENNADLASFVNEYCFDHNTNSQYLEVERLEENCSGEELVFFEAFSTITECLGGDNKELIEGLLEIDNLTSDIVGFVLELPISINLPGPIQPLTFLCMNKGNEDDGNLESLKKLYTKYPWPISGPTLLRLMPYNFSVLYYLSSHSIGQDILLEMLSKYPDTANAITTDALCTALSHNKTHSYNYLSTPLFQLCTQTPTETKPREYNDLATRMIERNIFILISSPEKLEALSTLFKLNPQLKETLSAEMICKVFPQNHPYSRFSILTLLSQSMRGRQLLLELVKVNHNLKQQFNAAALCVETKVDKRTFEPALHTLARTTATRKFLFELSESTEQVAHTITMDCLFKNMEDIKYDDEFVKAAENYWSRNDLKEIPTMIPLEVLTAVLDGPEKEDNVEKTLYAKLQKDGEEILALWHKQNPKLADEIANYLKKPKKTPRHALNERSKETLTKLTNQIKKITDVKWRYAQNKDVFWFSGDETSLANIEKKLSDVKIEHKHLSYKNRNDCIQIAATELMRTLLTKPSYNSENDNNRKPFIPGGGG